MEVTREIDKSARSTGYFSHPQSANLSRAYYIGRGVIGLRAARQPLQVFIKGHKKLLACREPVRWSEDQRNTADKSGRKRFPFNYLACYTSMVTFAATEKRLRGQRVIGLAVFNWVKAKADVRCQSFIPFREVNFVNNGEGDVAVKVEESMLTRMERRGPIPETEH